jgi:hypothetical protein
MWAISVLNPSDTALAACKICGLRITGVLLLLLPIVPPMRVFAEEPRQSDKKDCNIFDMQDDEIVARIGSDKICAGDVKLAVTDLYIRYKDSILATLPKKTPVDFSALGGIHWPDDHVATNEREREIWSQYGPSVLEQEIDRRLTVADARQAISGEQWEKIHSEIADQFEKLELPKLLKYYGVSDQNTLTVRLMADGKSLMRMRERYCESQITKGWILSQSGFSQNATEEQYTEAYKEYKVRLREGVSIWTIFDANRVSDFPELESGPTFPKTFREDSGRFGKMPGIGQ